MTRHLGIALLVLCIAAVPAAAGELLLGAAGKSSHRIVVPDSHPDAKVAQSVQRAAELVQRTFRENGIELAIVKESQTTDNRPGIYLGQTEFARKQGVDFDRMEGWTYTFRVVGRNLIVAGNDRPDPIPLEKRRQREAREGGIPWLGTLKGVTEFLYRFAGVRFLMPGAHGIEFLPTPVLYVPSDLNITERTHVRDIEIARSDDIYTIANGFEPSPTTLSNYGHYHHTVISPKEHGEAHPEYFVYHSGRRDNRANHLCFSNAEVRELIYRKILEDCDTGYDIIELGQNDGYRPCGCQECFNLYGIHPTSKPTEGAKYLNDPAWGEKIWIMHREMAVRLAKDRPGKRLMMCAYGPARRAPQTIDSFPENVIIQMMHPSPDIFAAWKRISVPGGFTAYTYTWGAMTPKNSIRHMEELTSTLLENKVTAIQNNLKPIDYGLEGPNVYAYRRMMNKPGVRSMDELFDEYIEAAYREAAGPMRRFFARLHQSLDFYPQVSEFTRVNRNPLLQFSALYTPVVISELEGHLARAEAIKVSAAVRQRLAKTRFEFDFLKHIVNTVTLYHAYLTQPDAESWDRALRAVETRNAWLASSERGKRPSFTFYETGSLKTPRGLAVEPLNWNTAQMRADGFSAAGQAQANLKVRKADRAVTLDAPIWKDVEAHSLQLNRGDKGPLQAATTFQVLYDDQNLYVRFDAELKAELMKSFQPRGRDEELWLQECLNILLAPTADRSQYYYLTYEPVANSFIDANHGFITDPLHPKFGWNDQTWDGEWTYANAMHPDRNRWVSMATIPFKTLGVPAPSRGTTWAANFGRIHYRNLITDSSHHARMANREVGVWTGQLTASRNPGEAHMGDVIFE